MKITMYFIIFNLLTTVPALAWGPDGERKGAAYGRKVTHSILGS